MTAMYRVLAVAFLAGLGTAFATPQQAQETRIGIERGAVPEAITLADVQGTEVDLGQYFGDGPVLIEFWATWCENCEALHP
ncbi:MAG: thioredoxin domain-containing protein, partial [Gemmatimonadales bacterium]